MLCYNLHCNYFIATNVNYITHIKAMKVNKKTNEYVIGINGGVSSGDILCGLLSDDMDG